MSAEPRAVAPPPGPLPAVRSEQPAAQTPDAAQTPSAAQAPPAVVAQILATEHWSLLGTRSMLWSELMSRISIHLTVSSAALVVLALVAQGTGFGGGFWVMAIGLASVILVLGTLTLLRVTIGSQEDHLLIAGMNRLRAAYRDLAPGIEEAFVTSASDDHEGVFATYTLGARRPVVLHAVSSTAFFLLCFNTMVTAVLAALITFVAGGATLAVALVGSGAAAVYLAAHTVISMLLFRELSAGHRDLGPVRRRHTQG
ncbi:hypothetical protein [Sinomonas sp. R1AF57]|uniref:hypothetical protein n=1 Tax=Sinomonas sp. R1AF57 TaxID=2020377 RepID=UPI000B5DF1CD|nr:hypothetical protein [Sinomonas sp. R1AF57]ASN52790.1 hypothetical protein CGQ25_12410 [Sinomonas sp. R1AF57]